MAFTAPTGPVIDDPIRPAALWYWIGGGLIAVAAIGSIVWLVTGFVSLDDAVDGFERVPYPDGGTITIDEPGDYVIYTESFSGDLRTSGSVLVDPDGDRVDTDLYVGSLNYDFGGRAGSASETFTADRTGDYELSAIGPDSTSISSLAVGSSIAGDLVSLIVGAFAIGGLGLTIGGVILLVTGVRRSRAKRERRPPVPPPMSSGQAPPTWGPQPQVPQPGWGRPPGQGQAQPGRNQPTPGPPPPTATGGATPPPPPGWPS